jgi:hypothetical protein
MRTPGDRAHIRVRTVQGPWGSSLAVLGTTFSGGEKGHETRPPGLDRGNHGRAIGPVRQSNFGWVRFRPAACSQPCVDHGMSRFFCRRMRADNDSIGHLNIGWMNTHAPFVSHNASPDRVSYAPVFHHDMLRLNRILGNALASRLPTICCYASSANG